MLPIFRFPFTTFNQINLDWIMKTLGEVKAAIPLVTEAEATYNRALAAIQNAESVVQTAQQQATAATASAAAAQGSADAAATSAATAATAAQQSATSAATAAQQATYAETEASAALVNSQTAGTNASAALASAQAAESASRWTYTEQLTAVNDNNNSPTLYSQYIDYTNAKGGLLLEFIDASNNYGSGNIEIPAPAIRGNVPNYWDNATLPSHYRTFYFGDTYKLTLRLDQMEETVGSGSEAVTHYYARLIVSPASSYYASQPIYINLYAR